MQNEKLFEQKVGAEGKRKTPQIARLRFWLNISRWILNALYCSPICLWALCLHSNINKVLHVLVGCYICYVFWVFLFAERFSKNCAFSDFYIAIREKIFCRKLVKLGNGMDFDIATCKKIVGANWLSWGMERILQADIWEIVECSAHPSPAAEKLLFENSFSCQRKNTS